jgi:hypothetical protein
MAFSPTTAGKRGCRPLMAFDTSINLSYGRVRFTDAWKRHQLTRSNFGTEALPR